MLKAHSSVTALLRTTGISIRPEVTTQRNVACMQHLLGAVRWKSQLRPAPLLTARPSRALIDEQISIQGRFLPPNCPVTVRAHMHSEEGDLWEAFSHYNTDENGVVNLTKDPSVGGSYFGCEPMGLFWALHPAPSAREGLRLRKRDVETPYVVQLSLWEGHMTSDQDPMDELAGCLAALSVERWYMAPHTRRVEIRQNGVVGTLFLPSGPGPFPAMVDLWGIGGGLNEYRSALFASKGIASLSLAYFGHKDIPGPPNQINVGDDYFRSAYNLLQDHPEVCGERIGLIGLSYGVYLVLHMATHIGLKPKCVIGINGPVGSNDKWPSMMSGSSPKAVDEHGNFTVKDMTMPYNIAKDNKIKIETLECPLLYILGEDDSNCASVESANEIEEVLRSAGKAQLFTRLSYPGAGHLIEPPYSPNTSVSLWRAKPKRIRAFWGGHPAPHAAAQEDAWKKMFDFMDCNLRR
ncbi:acyl-coenzyme A thioesterase 1-like [Gadus chalcogrammus]|uniref:acyl-coenzyme A thioesterase 1-like n=1 Tax=Gadus chalcogrammus TaxID=1042646 RepID=UPI0024C4B8CC|nr:acyl-coenzyme A thioesterase 1-like [Gadus chalcogrammus]